VDHSITDQSSVLRFVEDNWGLGRVGGGSFDARAGSLENMFSFSPRHKADDKLFLNETTGEPLYGGSWGHDSGHRRR
jgi:phospholipase C